MVERNAGVWEPVYGVYGFQTVEILGYVPDSGNGRPGMNAGAARREVVSFLCVAGCAAAGGIARERRVRESGDGVTGPSDSDFIEDLFSIPFPPGDYTVSSG